MQTKDNQFELGVRTQSQVFKLVIPHVRNRHKRAFLSTAQCLEQHSGAISPLFAKDKIDETCSNLAAASRPAHAAADVLVPPALHSSVPQSPPRPRSPPHALPALAGERTPPSVSARPPPHFTMSASEGSFVYSDDAFSDDDDGGRGPKLARRSGEDVSTSREVARPAPGRVSLVGPPADAAGFRPLSMLELAADEEARTAGVCEYLNVPSDAARLLLQHFKWVLCGGGDALADRTSTHTAPPPPRGGPPPPPPPTPPLQLEHREAV